MTEQQVRYECLKLAININCDTDRIISAARTFSDFVSRRKDAEIIRAAQEMAEKVNRD